MSALRFSQPTALTLLLMTAAVSLFVLEVEWPMHPVTAHFSFAAVTTLVLAGLLQAVLWGATTVGLMALWNVLRAEPLRRPVVAFGIGLAAFIGVTAYGATAYQDYMRMRPATGSSQSIPSEPPATKETK